YHGCGMATSESAREAQQLFFQIGMEHRQRVGGSLGELGLTFVQAHALRQLDPEQPIPMSSMAEKLFCDASNVTGIADRLESRKLVERRAADGDRRGKGPALTEAGALLAERVAASTPDTP